MKDWALIAALALALVAGFLTLRWQRDAYLAGLDRREAVMFGEQRR